MDNIDPIMPNCRSRRHVADVKVLEKYGASPILRVEDQDQPCGIDLAGWEITTSSSTIGNEGEMDALTAILQELIIDSHSDSRRLALPEIVFANAFVSLTRMGNNSGDDNVHDPPTMEVKLTAQNALEDWAECHAHLPLDISSSYKGVSVIKTVDAKLWEERQARERKVTSSSANNGLFGKGAAAAALEHCSTEFNYDWTYSTPYSGSVALSEQAVKEEQWKPIEASGIDFSLLTDQTQPILYFDDVSLYEDDMHDNGYVSLRCKIRVMPSCFFILLSLFVRVDHVLIRVKEVRLFSKFHSDQDTNSEIQVFRDISWKESSWGKLGSHQLPADVGSWRVEEELGGQAFQQRIQGMLRTLPQVALPVGMQEHACLTISI